MIRFFICALLLISSQLQAADTPRPNVLFIAVDDLRPQLSCYGKTKMHTPNIDQLAATGTLFERAYCMVPTCGASRASLMTGIRPLRNRFINYLAWAEKDAPGIPTMNTHFKKQGYTTMSLGKVLHHVTDSKEGWSEPAWRPGRGMAYHRPENQRLHRQRMRQNKKRGPAYESAEAQESAYPDGKITNKALATLKQLKDDGKPFFLAVGLLKPHLPFVAPKKYWDLYDPKDIQLPKTYHVPKNAPKQAIHSFGELRSYAGIPAKGPVSKETALKLIHGYYACVSFADAQIGRMLKELERLELSKNTIVVLWGDHGWNLGEHTLWCKHCCFETSMQIPMIIRAPGMKPGQRTTALTETIDLYPTLCQLTDTPAPSHLQGSSLVPLLKNPKAEGKGFAMGRYRTGDTLRTNQYRYTQYSGPRGRKQAEMLYDHVEDSAEDNNISDNEKVSATVKKLANQLRSKVKAIK